MINLSKVVKSWSYGVCTVLAALALGAAEAASAQVSFGECSKDL